MVSLLLLLSLVSFTLSVQDPEQEAEEDNHVTEVSGLSK